jgi:DNA-directed RNA polymerase specialized sigma subunit
MNKSKLYQYKIVEISFEQNKLNNFPMERGIGYILAENEHSDKIDDLKEVLLEELYDVVHSNFLTEHQKKILLMRLMGKTQNEIAEHLGITQSAVHKAMHGNIDYKNDRKRYGGIIKKLKKACKNNKRIKEVLKKIEDAKVGSDE